MTHCFTWYEVLAIVYVAILLAGVAGGLVVWFFGSAILDMIKWR